MTGRLNQAVEANRQTATVSLPRRPSLLNRGTFWGLLFGGLVLWSIGQAGLAGGEVVNPGGWPLVLQFFRAAVRPDLNPAFLAVVLKATLVTLAYAVCGVALSTGLGFVGGILASEVWWQAFLPANRQKHRLDYRVPWLVVRAGMALPRAIHEIIWGLFFVNILGLVPLTALLAIAIPFGAITAKVFSEILDETPRRPLEALLNSGASPLTAFIYGLLPPAFPNLLSYTFYRFECSIRAAAVLGIIGAGGLGYEILLSLQSLRYEQMWTLFFALFLLNGLADMWSGALRRRLGSANRIELNQPSRLFSRSLHGGQDWVVKGSLGGAVGLLAFSFWYLRPNFTRLAEPRTVQLLSDAVQASFPPRITAGEMGLLMGLSAQTLAMSVLAMVFAGSSGILLAFPAARGFLLPDGSHRGRLWWGTGIWFLTRTGLLVARSIPAPIWALILLYILFPGLLPGAVALGVYTLGILGRLMAEMVENLDKRPLLALQVQGAPAGQSFLYGVLPRTLPGFTAYILYRWEVCIRATVMVGLVGAGGLGRLLTEQLSSFDHPGMMTTLTFYLALTLLVDLVSTSVRRELRGRESKA
ncbi:MAG: ABC transporter permease subunit [Chloroflexi bacterium]|nr:MAG: ABC transporter permease subunit [Chloroflexota bacterium]